jgi:hypothetical protein
MLKLTSRALGPSKAARRAWSFDCGIHAPPSNRIRNDDAPLAAAQI